MDTCRKCCSKLFNPGCFVGTFPCISIKFVITVFDLLVFDLILNLNDFSLPREKNTMDVLWIMEQVGVPLKQMNMVRYVLWLIKLKPDILKQ